MSDAVLQLPYTVTLLAFVAGLAAAWLLRPALQRDDQPTDVTTAPDDTGLRQIADECSRELKAVSLRAERQTQELARTREHVRNLEEQAAAYLRQYAQAKDRLKKEIMQNGSLRAELAAGNAEAEALRGRVQELLMERAATGTHRQQTG